MSDNFYDTEFGPSTPGALNLISGQAYGATGLNSAGQVISDPNVIGSPSTSGTGTDVSDQDPDLSWLYKALDGGNLPSVSFVKAAAYADGHAGYSDRPTTRCGRPPVAGDLGLSRGPGHGPFDGPPAGP